MFTSSGGAMRIFKALAAVTALLFLLGIRQAQSAPAPVSISGSLTWTNSAGVLIPVMAGIPVSVAGFKATAVTNSGVVGPGFVVPQADGGQVLGSFGAGLSLTGPPWVLTSIGGAGGVVVLQGTNMVLTTNGFLITLNATTDTNMINAFLALATNNDIVRVTAITNGGLLVLSNYVNTLAANATNQSLKIGLNATNNDIDVAAGANVTIVTNAGLRTISSSGGGGGTGIQTNAGTGFNNILTNLTAATSFTNSAFSAIGVVTNDANGKTYTTPSLPAPLAPGSNAVPIASGTVTIVTNYVANGVTYTFTAVGGTGMSTNAGTGFNNIFTNGTAWLSFTNQGLSVAGIVTNDANGKLYTSPFAPIAQGAIFATNDPNGFPLSTKVAVTTGNGIVMSTNNGVVTVAVSVSAGTGVTLATNGSGVVSITAATGTGIQTNSGTGFNNNLTNLTVQGLLTGTNASSGWQDFPTGTNLTILEWNTNSAGVMQTNTLTIGSSPFLLEAANTNKVDVFTVTEDGKTVFTTNSSAWITTNGQGNFTGLLTENPWATNGVVTVFNLLDFGAIPNDGVSDKAALVAAFAAAATNSGIVYAPAGTYELGAAGGVIIPSGVTLMGVHAPNAGAGTRFNYTGTGPAIQLASSSKMWIKNIFLNGNVAVDSMGIASTNTADTVNGTTHWRIDNVRVFGFKQGFWFHNAWLGELNTCYADNCVDGLVISNTTSTIRIIGGEYSQCTNGVRFRGGNNFGITVSTTIENCSQAGSWMDDENNLYNLNIRYLNCHFEGNTNSIVTTNTEALDIRGNVFIALGTNVIFSGDNRGPTVLANYFSGQAPWNANNGVSAFVHGNNYPNTTFPAVSAAQSSVAFGSNVFLTGTAQLSTTGLTNTSFAAIGVVTNDAGGKHYTTPTLPNALLANSSITIAGTANQVSVAGGGPVALGGTATVSLPNPLLAPGPIATTGFTNTADAASQFKVTDANKGETTTLNGGALTNLNYGAVTGGTFTITMDGSYLWPGDTLAATWTTNTPSASSIAIQTAGPTIKAWSISQVASNRWLFQFAAPENWDFQPLTLSIGVVSGTNSVPANAQTNVWAAGFAVAGTALPTLTSVTNKLPSVTSGICSTNFDIAGLTVSGTITPGSYIIGQIESRAGNTPWSSTNLELLAYATSRYTGTNAQNNNLTRP
jgi:fibronectin-binding autotransporter adhesin